MDNIVVGVCYRPPGQEEDVDEAFFRQVKEASYFQALVLMESVSHSYICWRDNTVEHKKPRRFLEYIEDSFLTLLTEKPMRRGTLLDLLVFAKKKDLVEDVKAGSSFGCSDQ